jgi:hypothetical protein
MPKISSRVAQAAALVAILAFPALAQDTPTATSHVVIQSSSGNAAQVDTSGRLLTQQSSPANFFHAAAHQIGSASGCINIATAPNGKAIIVRQVRVDTTTNPAPGSSQAILIYVDKKCATDVGTVNPPGIGLTVVPFDPGVGLRAGMSVQVFGSIIADIYVDGYLVPASSVPDTTIQAVRGADARVNAH